MATNHSKEFAARIKEAAGEAGIYSPRELARLLGVQPQAVKQWYQGESRPNGKNLANLLSLLHVRYEWLMYGKHSDDAAENNASYSDLGTLVYGSPYGGRRAINEYEAARAMQLCQEAGIDITGKRIWRDRNRILGGLTDQGLRSWLQSAGSR